MKPDEMRRKTTPPRTEGSNPSLSATSLPGKSRDMRDKSAPNADPDHDQKWKEHFIKPIVKVMQQRGVAELHVVLFRDPKGKLTATSCPMKAVFELIPFDDELARAVLPPQQSKLSAV